MKSTTSRLAYDAGTAAIRHVNEYGAAKLDTAAFVHNPLAHDTAAGLYGEALKTLGVPVEPILRNQPAALRTLFNLATKGGMKPRLVAMDAKASARIDAMFPNARRLG